jgi:hypothetical protein
LKLEEIKLEEIKNNEINKETGIQSINLKLDEMKKYKYEIWNTMRSVLVFVGFCTLWILPTAISCSSIAISAMSNNN